MKNYIKVGDKIGYCNPKNGRYKFVEIVSIKNDSLIMLEIQKVSKYQKVNNIYSEKIDDILNWSKKDSPDIFGKKLIKIKSVNSNFLSEAAIRYNSYLNNL